MRSFSVIVALLAGLAAWLAPAAPAAAAGVYPVDGPVVRRFDPPALPWLPGHRGVDLRAAPGTPVRAAASGRVGFAGEVAGKPVVAVWHGTLRTTYEPVLARVRPGDPVTAGQVIGVLAAGHPCGPPGCLHWGLRRGEHYLDPLWLVTTPRVRLLPALVAEQVGGATRRVVVQARGQPLPKLSRSRGLKAVAASAEPVRKLSSLASLESRIVTVEPSIEFRSATESAASNLV